MSDDNSNKPAPKQQAIPKPPEKQSLEKNFIEKFKVELKEHKLEKVEKNESKELKSEKLEKNETKEHKDAKIEKAEKNEAKEHKDTKLESKEHKDTKHESKEHKDFKVESLEKLIVENIKQAGKEKDGKEVAEGPGQAGDPIEQRLSALEQSVAVMQHFITTGQRPDLSQGALTGEADRAAKKPT